jgi:hypothetical protein
MSGASDPKLLPHFEVSWHQLTEAIAASEKRISDTPTRHYVVQVLQIVHSYTFAVEDLLENFLLAKVPAGEIPADIGSFSDVAAIPWIIDFREGDEVAHLASKLLAEVQAGANHVDDLVGRSNDTAAAENWLTDAQGIRDQITRARFMEDALTLLSDVRESASEARASLRAARDAAGHTAEVRVSGHFDRMAADELRGVALYRSATFVLASLAVAFALLFYVDPAWLGSNHRQASATQSLAVRALAVLTLAGLAAYSSRLATQHREVFVWARTISVQIQTLDAFVEPLSDHQKDVVRGLAAARAFGAPSTQDAVLQDAMSAWNAVSGGKAMPQGRDSS